MDTSAPGRFSTPTPGASGLTPLQQRAREQMHTNIRTGQDPYYRRTYRYVRPSPGRYDFQWFWDSCFHVIVNAQVDPDLAKDEFRSLLATQADDGFIGHLTYWGKAGALYSALFMQSRFFHWRRRQSMMIQPPVLAHALEAIWNATGDRAFLNEHLPAVRRYYRWLRETRDLDQSGLVAIFSPFESGMDNSPAYDRLLGLNRPNRVQVLLATRALDLYNIVFGGNFNAKTMWQRNHFVFYDLFVNVAFADGLRALGRMLDASGDGAAASEETACAAATEAAINEHCWDGRHGVFVQLEGREHRREPTLTISSLMPAILHETPRERRDMVVERHLRNPQEFWTECPVPTVARSEPSFDPSGVRMIWRGPVCMSTNWLLVQGLRRQGFHDEADHIAARSRAAAERFGFREFYNPLTGEGLRGTRFGWGTLAAVM